MKVKYQYATERESTIGGVIVFIPADEVERKDAEADERLPLLFKEPAGDSYIISVGADGRILHWPKGETLDAYYKPRDSGRYVIKDADGNTLKDLDDGYVPDFLDMNEGGGDYLALKVDGDGLIDGFAKSFTPDAVAKYLTNVERD